MEQKVKKDPTPQGKQLTASQMKKINGGRLDPMEGWICSDSKQDAPCYADMGACISECPTANCISSYCV
jgi:hypothetical protein